MKIQLCCHRNKLLAFDLHKMHLNGYFKYYNIIILNALALFHCPLFNHYILSLYTIIQQTSAVNVFLIKGVTLLHENF